MGREDCLYSLLPTCNLRCPYCHAPHLVLAPNELESIPIDAVVSKIRQNLGWVDGIVVTGGEPTAHKHLDVLLKVFKDTGILVRLDTNGTNPHVLKDLIDRGLIDCVAMDIKAPLHREKYEQISGVPCNIEDIERASALSWKAALNMNSVPRYAQHNSTETISRLLPGLFKAPGDI